MYDVYLDALFVQLPCIYGLPCWVLYPQFTRNSFILFAEEDATDSSALSVYDLHFVLSQPDLPPGTAGTAVDPHRNVLEILSLIPPCCLYSWLEGCSCRYGHAQGPCELSSQINQTNRNKIM
jgi:hypothetical protein